MNKILIVPDVHCRSFYLNVLEQNNLPVVFLGDYMDPYSWEGFSDEEGIEKLLKIIEYKKANPQNVTLLVGNHDTSLIWSALGFERTRSEYYDRLHKIYRDNIELFEPCKLIKDTLFTHAGISNDWLNMISEYGIDVNESNIVQYITNEYSNELKHDVALHRHWGYGCLESPIFNIGLARGGDGYGGPTWCDFNYEFDQPDWKLWQIFGHTQHEITGFIRQKDNNYCVDSRAVFEYDLDTHDIKLSGLTKNLIKSE